MPTSAMIAIFVRAPIVARTLIERNSADGHLERQPHQAKWANRRPATHHWTARSAPEKDFR